MVRNLATNAAACGAVAAHVPLDHELVRDQLAQLRLVIEEIGIEPDAQLLSTVEPARAA